MSEECPKGEFYAFMRDKLRLSNSACVSNNCVVYKMMATGVTEEDLLTGDYVALVDRWLSVHNPTLTRGESKRRFRSAIRKYREYRGVEW